MAWKDGAAAETREISNGFNGDFDIHGAVVGVEIDGASRKIDLDTLETIALSFVWPKAA